MTWLIKIFTLSPSLVRRKAHSVNNVNNLGISGEPIQKGKKEREDYSLKWQWYSANAFDLSLF